MFAFGSCGTCFIVSSPFDADDFERQSGHSFMVEFAYVQRTIRRFLVSRWCSRFFSRLKNGMILADSRNQVILLHPCKIGTRGDEMSNEKQKHVVIIGAGPAGLTAAYELLE